MIRRLFSRRRRPPRPQRVSTNLDGREGIVTLWFDDHAQAVAFAEWMGERRPMKADGH